MAFFVFFQFKGGKRLILAEFPRQLIFSLNLRDVVNSLSKNPSLMMQFIEAYGHVAQSKPTLELMAFTLSALSVGIWVFSFVSLMANLKEYVCHRLIRGGKRQALAIGQWNEDAESEFSSTAPPLGMTQRPTLPDIDVDLDLPLSYTTASSSPCLSAVHGTLHSSCPRYPLHDSAVADFASGSRRSRTRSIASGGSPHLSFSREMTAVNSGTPVPPPLGLPPSLLFDRITAAGGSPFLGPTHPIPPSMTMPMMGTMAHHHLPMHFTGSLARPPYVHPAAGLPRSASSAPTVEGRRGTPSPSPPPGFCGDYGFGGWGDGFLVVQRDVDEIDVRDG
ncbi:hypothetical protein BC829DRAFT_397636 [Chytridium lagenaria]|nr:hypothetical protein BC829DRAFT_397636 [Chytridium lagenaria]